jgi:hypothetical protein
MNNTNKNPDTDNTNRETSGVAKTSAPTSDATEQRSPRTVTVALPFVTATFRRPELNLPRVRMPNRQETVFAAHTIQPYLPHPQQALYYGGLAALAAFEIIEWPVALAIGAAAALMGRSVSHRPQRQASTKPVTTATGETTSSAGSTAPGESSRSSSERPAGIPPSA